MFLISPNEVRPDWPIRKNFPDQEAWERAILQVQRQVPYYGISGDENLSWRQMVEDICSLIKTEENTFCWVQPAPKPLPKRVFPSFREEIRTGWFGTHRIIHITWFVLS